MKKTLKNLEKFSIKKVISIALILAMFLSITLVSIPKVNAEISTTTFGYTSPPTYSASFAYSSSRIRGGLATCNNDGNATSISVYLKADSAITLNAKCALYLTSGTSLVASTSQNSVSLTTSWQLFNFTFSTPPTVTADTQYYILIWINNTSPYYNAYIGSSGIGGIDTDYCNDSFTYGSLGSFPITLSLEQTVWGDDCIYATISESTTSPPITPSNNNFVNAMWIQHTSTILNNPTAFWSNFDNKGFNAIYYLDLHGGWASDGSIWYNESDTALHNLLAAIKTHNPNIAVLFSSYCDDSNMPDMSSSTIRNNMCAAVNNSFRNLGGYTWDGFITDIECTNIVGNLSYLVNWYHTFASNCTANNKVSAIYYGMHPWVDGVAADRTLLSSLTVNYINLEWYISSGSESQLYGAAVNSSAVPWLFQIRDYANNGGLGLTLQQQFTYFINKFGSTVPANFGGFSIWVGEDIIPTELSQCATNFAIIENLSPNPTPTPTSVPNNGNSGINTGYIVSSAQKVFEPAQTAMSITLPIWVWFTLIIGTGLIFVLLLTRKHPRR